MTTPPPPFPNDAHASSPIHHRHRSSSCPDLAKQVSVPDQRLIDTIIAFTHSLPEPEPEPEPDDTPSISNKRPRSRTAGSPTDAKQSKTETKHGSFKAKIRSHSPMPRFLGKSPKKASSNKTSPKSITPKKSPDKASKFKKKASKSENKGRYRSHTQSSVSELPTFISGQSKKGTSGMSLRSMLNENPNSKKNKKLRRQVQRELRKQYYEELELGKHRNYLKHPEVLNLQARIEKLKKLRKEKAKKQEFDICQKINLEITDIQNQIFCLKGQLRPRSSSNIENQVYVLESKIIEIEKMRLDFTREEDFEKVSECNDELNALKTKLGVMIQGVKDNQARKAKQEKEKGRSKSGPQRHSFLPMRLLGSNDHQSSSRQRSEVPATIIEEQTREEEFIDPEIAKLEERVATLKRRREIEAKNENYERCLELNREIFEVQADINDRESNPHLQMHRYTYSQAIALIQSDNKQRHAPFPRIDDGYFAERKNDGVRPVRPRVTVDIPGTPKQATDSVVRLSKPSPAAVTPVPPLKNLTYRESMGAANTPTPPRLVYKRPRGESASQTPRTPKVDSVGLTKQLCESLFRGYYDGTTPDRQVDEIFDMERSSQEVVTVRFTWVSCRYSPTPQRGDTSQEQKSLMYLVDQTGRGNWVVTKLVKGLTIKSRCVSWDDLNPVPHPRVTLVRNQNTGSPKISPKCSPKGSPKTVKVRLRAVSTQQPSVSLPNEDEAYRRQSMPEKHTIRLMSVSEKPLVRILERK